MLFVIIMANFLTTLIASAFDASKTLTSRAAKTSHEINARPSLNTRSMKSDNLNIYVKLNLLTTLIEFIRIVEHQTKYLVGISFYFLQMSCHCPNKLTHSDIRYKKLFLYDSSIIRLISTMKLISKSYFE